MDIDDIMISFQYSASRNNVELDFSLDEKGDYISNKTRKAYFWYKLGFIQGEKA